MIRLGIIALLLVSLSGCFEFIEDLHIKNDGSGTYKLTLNLSASRMKVKSVMALDSIKGREVPKKSDISNELAAMTSFFETQRGISNVSSKIDFDDLIIRFQMDFDRLPLLEEAIIKYINQRLNEPSNIKQLFEFKDGKYQRFSLDYLLGNSWKQELDSEDVEKLGESSVVLITRFSNPIKSVSSDLVSISKNQTASMFRSSATKILDQVDKHAYSVVLETE
jgi:hypothetical protein